MLDLNENDGCELKKKQKRPKYVIISAAVRLKGQHASPLYMYISHWVSQTYTILSYNFEIIEGKKVTERV